MKEHTGIAIRRVSFNEPLCGKDVCYAHVGVVGAMLTRFPDVFGASIMNPRQLFIAIRDNLTPRTSCLLVRISEGLASQVRDTMGYKLPQRVTEGLSQARDIEFHEDGSLSFFRFCGQVVPFKVFPASQVGSLETACTPPGATNLTGFKVLDSAEHGPRELPRAARCQPRGAAGQVPQRKAS